MSSLKDWKLLPLQTLLTLTLKCLDQLLLLPIEILHSNRWCSQIEEVFLKEIFKIQKEWELQFQTFLMEAQPKINFTHLVLIQQETKSNPFPPLAPKSRLDWIHKRDPKSGSKNGWTILLSTVLVTYYQTILQEYFSMIPLR